MPGIPMNMRATWWRSWRSRSSSIEEENRRLRRELAESRRANEILKAASVFFARELDHPTTK